MNMKASQAEKAMHTLETYRHTLRRSHSTSHFWYTDLYVTLWFSQTIHYHQPHFCVVHSLHRGYILLLSLFHSLTHRVVHQTKAE